MEKKRICCLFFQCDQVCRFGKQPIAERKVKKWDGVKKVLIINPWNASTKKTAGTTAKTTKKTDSNIVGTTTHGPKPTKSDKTPASGATTASIGTTKSKDDGAPSPSSGGGETPAGGKGGWDKTK